MLPLVAIVGRPNVGKSTLFNRLIRARKAIVQDDPGVTRDRHYGIATFEGRAFTLIDTGGFEPDAAVGIEALVREQTQLAIDEADLVLLTMDAREGLTDSDRAVVDALRRTGKKVIHVANKVDGPRQEAEAAELYRTGATQIFNISAEHALGLEELIDAILAALPPAEAALAPEEHSETQLALVGRPNAGKSSLLNALVGQPRAIVSETPGTTRDPVDVRLETPQGGVVIVDTAGIRRHSRPATAMEKFAVVRALRCVSDCDVACLLIDAAEGVAEQDAKIASVALEAGRGLVLVCAKSDLLVGTRARKALQAQIAEDLQFVRFAPVLFLSATTGQGVQRLIPTVRRVHRECGRRVTTAELNRFLEQVATAHPPPAHRGRSVRFYYITQPQAYPPTFIVSTSSSEIHATYRRYMLNKLRDRFGFEGAPLRIFFRQRGRKSEG
jgi:GTPase